MNYLKNNNLLMKSWIQMHVIFNPTKTFKNLTNNEQNLLNELKTVAQ